MPVKDEVKLIPLSTDDNINFLSNDGEYKHVISAGLECNPICKKKSGHQPWPNFNKNCLFGFVVSYGVCNIKRTNNLC